ncbi:hypothetical protein D9758_015668 [Tetrapyrgos nigripes]|uniref:Uncharacterized protein n=1 Tax=Tetrapyrgos nigripes TaxID=182062 RepID=A0A8H5C9K1_9AGAR|nr:hypothetical protein D9758_015668 [Tetrapyrgos nigripes]
MTSLRSAMKHSSPSPLSSPFSSTHGLPAFSSSPTDDAPPLSGRSSTSSRPSTSAGYSADHSTHSSSLLRTASGTSLSSAPSTASTLIVNPLSPNPYATPVPGYTPKVSFDTFENPVASMFSFTLRSTSAGYTRNRNTRLVSVLSKRLRSHGGRVFLCASSPDESGQEALDWSLESFVQDGDELVVFRGVEEDVLGV